MSREATGVSADGRRGVLGFAVGDSEERPVLDRVPAPPWKARGLAGTKLVISDAHAGLKAASAAVMIDAKLAALWLKFLRATRTGSSPPRSTSTSACSAWSSSPSWEAP